MEVGRVLHEVNDGIDNRIIIYRKVSEYHLITLWSLQIWNRTSLSDIPTLWAPSKDENRFQMPLANEITQNNMSLTILANFSWNWKICAIYWPFSWFGTDYYQRWASCCLRGCDKYYATLQKCWQFFTILFFLLSISIWTFE